ncbi:MAG TPA: single-stranded DNA-binding protein [Polyangiaceae bacterium]|jgi:single-strand DNA-binding protein
MAEGLNRVFLFGNLGADPELRVTQTGQSVLKLRLATTESYLDRDRVRQERTEWHRVVIWGKRAEALSKFLTKGARVFVEGGLRTSSYEKDGIKRYSTDIVASNIILGGRGGGRGEEYPSVPAAASRAAEPSSSYDEADYGGGADDEIPF